MIQVKIDPDLDLVLDRVIDVPRELVWQAWTQPEHLKAWFCPLPWKTVDCEIDLRPGGVFRTEMRGPAGEAHTVLGCYLEVVEHERLAWTVALGPGFRPQPPREHVPFFTAIVTFEKRGSGTRYLVQALHLDARTRTAHEKMGFVDGWGKALEQLVAHCKAR
jgi:uncharacterized protein YndB with AHSA1/START domain